VELFVSKRHRVYREGDRVIKCHASVQAAAAEASLLRTYHRAGLRVPELLFQRGSELVMEYIPGETIPDFLAHRETESGSCDASLVEATLVEAARGLCSWFADFYQAVGYMPGGEIRGDVNGRNFIIENGRVSSVDFEERAFGRAEEDIGRLIAFIYTYTLSGTRVKRRFAKLVYQEALEILSLSALGIIAGHRAERAAMRKRRRSPAPASPAPPPLPAWHFLIQ